MLGQVNMLDLDIAAQGQVFAVQVDIIRAAVVDLAAVKAGIAVLVDVNGSFLMQEKILRILLFLLYLCRTIVLLKRKFKFSFSSTH